MLFSFDVFNVPENNYTAIAMSGQPTMIFMTFLSLSIGKMTCNKTWLYFFNIHVIIVMTGRCSLLDLIYLAKKERKKTKW